MRQKLSNKYIILAFVLDALQTQSGCSHYTKVSDLRRNWERVRAERQRFNSRVRFTTEKTRGRDIRVLPSVDVRSPGCCADTSSLSPPFCRARLRHALRFILPDHLFCSRLFHGCSTGAHRLVSAATTRIFFRLPIAARTQPPPPNSTPPPADNELSPLTTVCQTALTLGEL